MADKKKKTTTKEDKTSTFSNTLNSVKETAGKAGESIANVSKRRDVQVGVALIGGIAAGAAIVTAAPAGVVAGTGAAIVAGAKKLRFW